MTSEPTPADWDVLVIGRSFAGLSAALTLARPRRSVLVVGQGGPRNASVRHAHGFLTRDGASPVEMVADAEAQLERYPTVDLVDDRVTSVERIDGGFRATFGKRTTTATFVLIATGVNDDPPDIAGLADHWGRGVYTCPFCDGFEHQDLHLAVVGSTAFSPHTATMLRGWTDRVTLFAAGLPDDVASGLRGAGVVLDERAVVRVVGDGESVTALELDDGTRTEVGAVFSAALPRPNHGLAVDLGCELDEFGFVVVDADQRTTVEGVWAAGDVTSMRHQMVFAAADGARAAFDCYRSLLTLG